MHEHVDMVDLVVEPCPIQDCEQIRHPVRRSVPPKTHSERPLLVVQLSETHSALCGWMIPSRPKLPYFANFDTHLPLSPTHPKLMVTSPGTPSRPNVFQHTE